MRGISGQLFPGPQVGDRTRKPMRSALHEACTCHQFTRTRSLFQLSVAGFAQKTLGSVTTEGVFGVMKIFQQLLTKMYNPPTAKSTGPRSGVVMNCALCASSNQVEFPAEINIHFLVLQNLAQPGVFVFPRLVVCLDCGFTRFSLPESALALLRGNIAA